MNPNFDGGQAFPVADQGTHGTYGMSLRDYFAAKAMHAELVTNGVPGPSVDALLEAARAADRTPEEQMAWNAYQMADAMLAEREKAGVT